MLNRQEFSDYWNSVKSGLGDEFSVLWASEQHITSQWFICVEPLGVNRFKEDFWWWCDSTLKGAVLCYSTDNDNHQEWWGFTDQEDIPLWILKWT